VDTWNEVFRWTIGSILDAMGSWRKEFKGLASVSIGRLKRIRVAKKRCVVSEGTKSMRYEVCGGAKAIAVLMEF